MHDTYPALTPLTLERPTRRACTRPSSRGCRSTSGFVRRARTRPPNRAAGSCSRIAATADRRCSTSRTCACGASRASAARPRSRRQAAAPATSRHARHYASAGPRSRRPSGKRGCWKAMCTSPSILGRVLPERLALFLLASAGIPRDRRTSFAAPSGTHDPGGTSHGLCPAMDRSRGLQEGRSHRRRRRVVGSESAHAGEPASPRALPVRRDAGRLWPNRGAQFQLGVVHRARSGHGGRQPLVLFGVISVDGHLLSPARPRQVRRGRQGRARAVGEVPRLVQRRLRRGRADRAREGAHRARRVARRAVPVLHRRLHHRQPREGLPRPTR